MAARYLSKIAITGAGGNSGRYMTQSLLGTGRHTVTALTRNGSNTKLPLGVIPRPVEYSERKTLVEALRGQEALIITLNGFAPKETEVQLIEAAGEAGVGWIFTNEWGPDSDHDGLVADMPPFQSKRAAREVVKKTGKSSFISLSSGYWYEWTLAKPDSFGIDFGKRAVNFYDDGEIKICVSTWQQIGRAVAGLLSLPVSSDGPCLNQYRNKVVYTYSFSVNQKDMFESAVRVTGTNASDWTVTYESSRERYAAGAKEVKEGNFAGFPKMSCRIFFGDCGDFRSKGTVNEALKLPVEDLDEATARAMERAKQS